MNELYDLIRCLHCGNLGTAAAQVAKFKERVGDLRFNGLIYSLSVATPAQLREWTEKALHEPEYTDWAPTSLHPQRSGVYQVRWHAIGRVHYAYYDCLTRGWYRTEVTADEARNTFFRGKMNGYDAEQLMQWRGLAKDPAPTRSAQDWKALLPSAMLQARVYTTPPTELLQKRNLTDTERLDWVMHNISGVELRRLGVITSAGCTREHLDFAILNQR
jgi:hypothetical protein